MLGNPGCCTSRGEELRKHAHLSSQRGKIVHLLPLLPMARFWRCMVMGLHWKQALYDLARRSFWSKANPECEPFYWLEGRRPTPMKHDDYQLREKNIGWKHTHLSSQREKMSICHSYWMSDFEDTWSWGLSWSETSMILKADCFDLGQTQERTILLIRRPHTDAHKIWRLSIEGERRWVKACTSMMTNDSFRSQFVLKSLAEKHFMHTRRSDDDRIKGDRREHNACQQAGIYFSPMDCTSKSCLWYSSVKVWPHTVSSWMQWSGRMLEIFWAQAVIMQRSCREVFEGVRRAAARARPRIIGGSRMANWRKPECKRGALNISSEDSWRKR